MKCTSGGSRPVHGIAPLDPRRPSCGLAIVVDQSSPAFQNPGIAPWTSGLAISAICVLLGAIDEIRARLAPSGFQHKQLLSACMSCTPTMESHVHAPLVEIRVAWQPLEPSFKGRGTGGWSTFGDSLRGSQRNNLQVRTEPQRLAIEKRQNKKIYNRKTAS